MTRRSVGAAPELPGFTFSRLIGSGGYADVFLYDQHLPERQVAIKVLDAEALSDGTSSYDSDEANVMAKVSAHPYIVQVFQASISPDGRPVLVMEYYPHQNFQERARNEHMSVAETLRVGIQIASAVETAHRAGILHRDIKPANILTSEYGHPGLTDFGIAASADMSTSDPGDGLSIPWSPPEAFGQATTTLPSEVYSLAATVYTMLAGRSPFEVPGGDNKALAMMSRIEREPVPPTGRVDVPAQLEQVLANAMAKDPLHRPQTAAEFARQLQAVESSLALPVTQLELANEGGYARVRAREFSDEDATRVKSVKLVEAHPAPSRREPSPSALSHPVAQPTARSGAVSRQSSPGLVSGTPVGATQHRVAGTASTAHPHQFGSSQPAFALHDDGRMREGMLPTPDVGDTLSRQELPALELPEITAPTGFPKVWYAAVGIAVALVLIVGIGVLVERRRTKPAPVAEQTEVVDNVNVAGASVVPVNQPEPVQKIEGTKVDEGRYNFRWEHPDDKAVFTVTPIEENGAAGVPVKVTDRSIEVATRCIDVYAIGENQVISAKSQGCAP